MNADKTTTRAHHRTYGIHYFANKIDGISTVEELMHIVNLSPEVFKSQNEDGDSSLYLASKYKQYELLAIRLFDLSRMANIEPDKCRRDYNEIHHAVICESYHFVMYLLRHDACHYLNVKDKNRNNALHLACLHGHYDIITLLLNYMDYTLPKQKTINDKNGNGDTALHVYCKYDCCRKFCMEYILHNDYINVNLFDKEGYTALHCAIEASYSDDYDNVEILLKDEKVRVDIKNRYTHETPLHSACKICNVMVIRLILERSKKSIDAKDRNGSTPLMVAVEFFFTKTIQKQYDFVQAVILLLEAGADVNCTDKNRVTPLQYLCKNNTNDLLPENIQPLRDLVDCLLNNKFIDVNGADRYKNTALHSACNYGNIEMVTRLLEHNDIQLELLNNRKHTPLMMIINMMINTNNNHLRIIDILITQGEAKLNCKTIAGRTLLHQACLLGKESFVRQLLNYDATLINEKNNGGIPLLFEACNRHNMNGRNVDLLLRDRRCDHNIISKINKRSVFHYAILHYNVEALHEIMNCPGINLEKPDGSGNTIFHYVIKESFANRIEIDEGIYSLDGSIAGRENIEHRRRIKDDITVQIDALMILNRVLNSLPFRNLFTSKNKNGYSAYDIVKEVREDTTNSMAVNTIQVKRRVNEYVFQTRCRTYEYMMTYMNNN